jgi:hypothetical protein
MDGTVILSVTLVHCLPTASQNTFPLRLEKDCSHSDLEKCKQVSATKICWNCLKLIPMATDAVPAIRSD